MMQSKKIIGITGGSGCGKSFLCSRLRERGITVVDADVVAREVMEKGSPCFLETVECFGAEIIDESGALNRRKLGGIVFSDAEKLKKLNEITHKYIIKSIFNKIEAAKSEVVCIDGATLIENGIKCDLMIGVTADDAVRIKRISERDSVSREYAKARIDAQQRRSFYEKNCDFVICNNDGNIDIDRIYKRIIDEKKS